MATSKRERQKAARREKLERMQRYDKRRKNIRRVVIVVVIAVLVIGTGALLFSGKKSPTTTTTSLTTTSTSTTSTTTTLAPVAFAPVAQPSPAGVFGTAPTVVVPSGAPPTAMESTDLIKGTGAVATDGKSLTVQYVLATYSSRKVVQSSWTSAPFSFILGIGKVIPGWDEGVVGMRVGGRRELVIPPLLGYKNVPQGPGIAANDTLVFVIDLLKVS
jgi:peptidylprolyl isomerase